MARWEKVRGLALAKQAELSGLVMVLQRANMEELQAWLVEAEATLASLALAPATREQLEELRSREERLVAELEEQQATVSSISHFILVDTEETAGVEEELGELGERWHALCEGCEEVHRTLSSLHTLWGEVELQEEEVSGWLAAREEELRRMELEEVEGEELAEQARHVMVSTWVQG